MRSALISGLAAFAMVVSGPVLAKATKHRVAAPRNQIAQQEAMLAQAAEESYCEIYASQPRGSIGFRTCVNEQLAANRQLNAFGAGAAEQINDCVHYVTGMRSLGSDEIVDAVDTLACMRTPDRDKIFSNCVLEVTGTKFDGDIRWSFEGAEKIQRCFATAIAPFRPKKTAVFDWENGRAWTPVSRHSVYTTGPVRITKTSISFSGVSVPLEFMRPFTSDFSGMLNRPVEGALYRIVHDPGPLIFGNTLCSAGDRAKFLVIGRTPGSPFNIPADIALYVFGSKANPESLNESGYCEEFDYKP